MGNCKVIDSQKDAIDGISYRMETFVKSKAHTRVVPLIIPTGWGKTRIAVQSIKKIYEERRGKCTIILWPQNRSHISKEVWKRPSDWSKEYSASASKEEVLGWRNLLDDNDDNNHFFYITRSSQNKKNYKKSIDRTQGPIFFIIDEWHSKQIVFQYIDYKNKVKSPLKNPEKIPETFWRKLLLEGDIDKKKSAEKKGKKRRLFVLLLSATPIASTRHMDEMRVDYEKDLDKVLEAFNELITVGNKRAGKFYEVYPQLIGEESGKLASSQARYKKKTEYSDIVKGGLPLDKWLDQYIERSKILMEKDKTVSSKDYDPQIYMKEQALLCGLYPKKDRRQKDPTLTKFAELKNIKGLSLKEEMLISLLKKNGKQRFVVFCHHIEIAKHLESVLNAHFGDKFAYYLYENNFGSDEFKQFNNPKSDGKTRALIVTDKHSQGVSMHESSAWLVHYELSWNPIRIIQRFGRVWRLLNNKMTSPVAFHMPYPCSSEEEQIRRLEERWKVLTNKKKKIKKGLLKYIDISPISKDVALGIRITPAPSSSN